MTLDILHEGEASDLVTLRAWAAQAGLLNYVVFEPFDGPCEPAEALVRLPLALITVKLTPTRMRLFALVRSGCTYKPFKANCSRKMSANFDDDVTFLMHGLTLPVHRAEIKAKWYRGVKPWHEQLKGSGLIVMRTL